MSNSTASPSNRTIENVLSGKRREASRINCGFVVVPAAAVSTTAKWNGGLRGEKQLDWQKDA